MFGVKKFVPGAIKKKGARRLLVKVKTLAGRLRYVTTSLLSVALISYAGAKIQTKFEITYFVHTFFYIINQKFKLTMAKGNLFLGTGTRSVGDVTLMRRNGAQVSRVRVRKIANPKSDGQATQRMYVAAVPKFYAPLAMALERSYEGKNKSESYSAFLKDGINRLKNTGYCIPKGTGFYPIPVKLSHGSLPSIGAQWDEEGSKWKIALGTSNATTIGELSAALEGRYGLQDGDQITLIGASQNPEDPDSFIASYTRFFLDSTSSESFGTMDFFELDISGSNLTITDGSQHLYGLGIIVSRYENGSWRRSVSYMNIADFLMLHATSPGTKRRSRESYQADSTTPTSNIYLNGSTGGSDVQSMAFETEAGTEHTVVNVSRASKSSTSGGTTQNVTVYELTDDEGNKLYINDTNQRSDYLGKVFAPDAVSDNVYLNKANIDGLDENNVIDIDTAHMTSAEVDALWEFMQQFGIGVEDLTKFFAPAV